jgi:hypothetical protein
MLAKFCVWFLRFVIKCTFVVVESLLESVRSEADVRLLLVALAVSYCGLINNWYLQTFPVYRAIFWLVTVACFLVRYTFGLFGQNAFIMSINDMFNVCRTSVAHLNRVPVEYFTQRMVFREFFVQYLEKFTPDVCRYVSAIWGVVPDDSSRTVSSLFVGLVCNREAHTSAHSRIHYHLYFVGMGLQLF